MAAISPVVSCLSASMSTFIAQEAAKLTEKVASIISSFTDPVEALAASNISTLVDDVSSLASGNVLGNMASIGEAILINKMKRELNGILADVIKNHPAVGDAIQRITNLSEAVYGIVSLAILLRKDSPFSAVGMIVDDILEMLDVKEKMLNEIKKHMTQLNNVVMSAVNNPTKTSEVMMKSFEKAYSGLTTASSHFLSLESNLRATVPKFVDKEYNGGLSGLQSARSSLCKDTDGVNILDVGSAMADGVIGVEHLTEAQIQLSGYSMIPLTNMITCEMNSIDRSNDRITMFLTQISDVIPNYQRSLEADKMKEFRVSLVSEIRKRIDVLAADIKESIEKHDVNMAALHSMSWCSRMGSIEQMAPKVKNKVEDTLEDEERREQMIKEISDMMEAINQINDGNMSAGIEDMAPFLTQVTLVINQAKMIMSIMGTGKIDNYDIKSFRITVNQVVNNGHTAIGDSLKGISKLRSALGKFKSRPSGNQTLDKLLSVLELMGLDRAKDLLKFGKFSEFLETNIDNASYIGMAINCLIKAEQSAVDSVTLDLLSKMRQELEGQRISELSAAFDILDSGKNSAILEIKRHLERGQENLAKVNRIVDTLKDLAKKAGETGEQLSQAAGNLAPALGEIATGMGGSMNETLSELDIKGVYGGCQGMMWF